RATRMRTAPTTTTITIMGTPTDPASASLLVAETAFITGETAAGIAGASVPGPAGIVGAARPAGPGLEVGLASRKAGATSRKTEGPSREAEGPSHKADATSRAATSAVAHR